MAYFCILLKVSSKNYTFGQRLLSLGPGRFVLISFQIKGLCHKYAPLGPWLGQETYKLGFFLCIYWSWRDCSSTVCLVSGIVQSVGIERISQKKLNPSHQCKFYSVNVDYSKLKKEGPDF